MNILFIILACCSTVFCAAETTKPIGENTMDHFVLIGKMKAKPNCETQLHDTLQKLSATSHTEPGCLFYALHRDAQDSSIFVLIEGWASQEAFQAHLTSPHFYRHFPDIQSLTIGEPQLSNLTPLGEGKKGNLFYDLK
jgi:quinol monooxygenase YgiN